MKDIRAVIEQAWEQRELLQQEETQNAVRAVVDALDAGTLRVAEPTENGWQVNEWVKKAVVLYFPIQKMETIEVGPFEFHDKIPLKRNYAEEGRTRRSSCRSTSRLIHRGRCSNDAFLRKHWCTR